MFSRCSRVPKSLSEGAISGPDKLQKTVPPPGGTEKGLSWREPAGSTGIGAISHRLYTQGLSQQVVISGHDVADIDADAEHRLSVVHQVGVAVRGLFLA